MLKRPVLSHPRLRGLPGLIERAKALGFAGSILLASTQETPAQSSDTTPPHRRHHALAYDSAGRPVLLFGGQHLVSNTETPMLDDLWSWDGRRWTRVAASTGLEMIAHQLYADGAGGVFAGHARGRMGRNGSL